jgi:hypothetical protein
MPKGRAAAAATHVQKQTIEMKLGVSMIVLGFTLQLVGNWA